ncbi:MAG TPA: hypothetical protein PLX45_07395 [Piscinibacter sp.]|jgi:hypothetical protein|uniref:hypothetical protein n=1 Tax=Piscinibacter sp. TaxID=1903157 RepID=UPI001B73EE2C|nr:hypothetical protein [Piscinibacter sp.]MBK7532595.1 hypothetical protein [Piscinibacter sp.]MBL0091838.1 hypothetical protein [Piscinibacter sp.]MBP6542327.1 hypothetical protein [Piscinibacter sp.]HNW64039.1 hypothetical protein [Piscinibacter sp.]HPG79620.1 hypothetical protein [Piscinibacter sp.]
MKRHLAIFALALLAGCDMLGIESPEKVAATREADGKAVGGACRHAGRAIEDCYALNKKADRAAVFAGWRDMNDYMRENKIEEVPPQIAGVAAKPAAEEVADAHVEKRPAKGSESKAKDKPKARES